MHLILPHDFIALLFPGLQLTIPDVWKLFAALTSHEVAIHFCVGVDMLASRTRKRHILLYMATLAAVTCAGVLVGTVITENATSGGGDDGVGEDGEADAVMIDGAHTLAIGILQVRNISHVVTYLCLNTNFKSYFCAVYVSFRCLYSLA